MKLLMTFLFATLIPAQAEWTTIAAAISSDEEKTTESIVGVIKVIYMDEENNRVRVRVKAQGEDIASEEFVLCNPNESNEELNLIRQAFAEGAPVRVALSGSFNKCLSKLQYVDSQGDLKQVGI